MNSLCTSLPFKQQRGAATVEAAIVMMLFLALVFAIIEFAFALLKYEQSVEATRAGARVAMVSDPVCDLFGDLAGSVTDCPLNCDLGSTSNYIRINCNDSGVACGAADPPSGLLGAMVRMLPELAPENVNLIYACSGAGFEQRPIPVPSITVSIEGITHPLILPTLFGFEAGLSWDIPPFSSTRLGEDLETVPPSL
ncbi:MAG: TadE family protein [Sedimenticola sp.]